MATLGELAVKVGVTGLDEFVRTFGTMSEQLKSFDKQFDRTWGGIEKVGDRLKSIGGGLTAAVTLPLVGAGAAATKFAADFESEMRKVTSLLGGTTQREFKELNDKTLELSRSLGVDATKSAQALYEAISAGIPQDNAIEFVGVATKAAIAGTTDAKVAVDALTTIIAAYGLKTTEASQVSDALFQAVNVGKFQFEDLAKAIGPAAQQASNLGISYQELLAATGTLSITSGGVSIAVTQIESAMRALLDPTKEMKAALNAIGFESGSAAVNALGFEATLQKLREQAKGSAEAFNAMFGRIEGANAALGLTGEKAAVAAKDYDILKRSSEGVGATQKALNEINQTTQRQYEQITAELKATAIELGTALLPAVNSLLQASRPLIDLLAGMVDVFTKLPSSVQTVAIGLAGMAAAVVPLLFGLGQLTTTITGAARAYQSLMIVIKTSEIGSAITGNLIGPLTLAQSRVLSFLNVLKGLSVPVTVGIIAYQALDALTKTETATANLTKAMDRQKQVMADLNEKYREQEVLAGRLYPQVNNAKETVLDFVKALPAAAAGMKSLNEATKGGFSDADRKKIEDYKSEILDSEKATRLKNQALRELGKEVKDASDSENKYQKAVENADKAYKEALRGYQNGKVSIEKLSEAQERLIRAQDAAEPERVAKRHAEAYFSMLDRYDAMAKGILSLNQQLAEAEKDLADSVTKNSIDFGKAYQGMVERASEAVNIIVPLNKRIPEGIQDALKETRKVNDAYRQLGIQTPAELQKVAEANRNAWETVSRDSGANSVAALEGWIKMRESEIELARRSGREVSKAEEEQLRNAKDQLDRSLGEKTESWKRFTRQVSTIVNDLAKDLAAGTINLFKGLFGFDDFNRKLTEDSVKLRAELADRQQALEEFRLETEVSISGVNSRYAQQLESETADLTASLAERRQEYEAYTVDVALKLESLRNQEAERLAEEQQDLADKLRDKEAEYEEYARDVAEKESEIRQKHEDQLALQLRSLRENLADRVQAYEDFVTDANTRLGRIAGDLEETISDATRNVNRRIEDENIDFARDQEKLQDDLRKAEARGDKDQVAQIRKNLDQRRQDHERTIKRLREDLDEQVSDARKRAEEQTADAKLQLDRRARDQQQFLEENARAQADATEKHRTEQEKQLADLHESLEDRANALLAYRERAAAAMEEAATASEQRLRKEENELQISLDQRLTALTAYEAEVNKKIEDLTAKYTDKQAKEVAELQKGFTEKLSEYDKYRADVEQKLTELEDAHKGPLDRIREMFANVFESAANAVLRLVGEEVIGKLFKALKELATDILPGVGRAITGAFGGLVAGAAPNGVEAISAANQAVGGVLGAGGSAGGAAGAVGSVAGSAVSGVVGMVTGAVSAVSGVIGNFQMAGMNKTLDLIEHEVRYSQIHLKEILERGVNVFLSQLPSIRELYMQFLANDAWRIHDVWAVLGEIRDLIRMPQPAAAFAGEAGVMAAATIDGTQVRPMAEVWDQSLRALKDSVDAISQVRNDLQFALLRDRTASDRPITIYLNNYLDNRVISSSIIRTSELQGGSV